MKSDYCDEAYDRVIASSVSDDELFSQIKLLGYNKDEEKKEILIVIIKLNLKITNQHSIYNFINKIY